MKKSRILYLSLTALIIIFFVTSFSLANYIIKNNLKLQAYGTMPYFKLIEKSDKDNLLQTSVTTNLNTVSESAKLVFKIKYRDIEVRNMVLEKHFSQSKLLVGKTQTALNEILKRQGYVVEAMSDSEIVFVNNSDRYSYKADRYFLGVFDDVVTIYKTDENGNIVDHKLFNADVAYNEDGNPEPYDFKAKEKREPQYIKVEDLKEKDGLVDNLIRGEKHTKDGDGSEYAEDSEDYSRGEFKDPENAFEYGRALLSS